jgi:hypothetical protein
LDERRLVQITRLRIPHLENISAEILAGDVTDQNIRKTKVTDSGQLRFHEAETCFEITVQSLKMENIFSTPQHSGNSSK